jgi:O-acetyl-ADP-ribose deacetylase (regulator of RNase III)
MVLLGSAELIVIVYLKGNLFDANAEAIVNTVNCVGIMGRGIALQFSRQYPDNTKAYKIACERGEVVPGKMFVHQTNQLVNPRYIVNFPTKRHWRGASRIEDIEAGLANLGEVIREQHISSIALPPLGTGLGGLKWEIVKDRIETALGGLADIHIEVYLPNDAVAAKQMAKNRAVPKMTPGRAALVRLTQRYLDGLLDPFVTLLEIHKLMYFLQECGQPLKLKFVEHYYGPFATNLSQVLKTVEGNLLSGYADGGDKPDKQISVVPGAVEDAAAFLADDTETFERIAKVTELVDGFETPFGMELLATVHWVAKDGCRTLPQIVSRTYGWGPQKQKFSDRQIRLAAKRLADKGWIPALTETSP